MERLRYSRIMLPDQRKDWMTRDLDPGVKNGFSTGPLSSTAAEVAMAKREKKMKA